MRLKLLQLYTLLASFPGSHPASRCLQLNRTASDGRWAGPGNEANTVYHLASTHENPLMKQLTIFPPVRFICARILLDRHSNPLQCFDKMLEASLFSNTALNDLWATVQFVITAIGDGTIRFIFTNTVFK